MGSGQVGRTDDGAQVMGVFNSVQKKEEGILPLLPGDLQDKVDPYLRPLYDALQFLRTWVQERLIAADSFNMDKQTVGAFMQNNLASVVIMSLADHRSINHDAIEPFVSVYFPSELSADRRHFIAPVFYAVPFSKNAKGMALIAKLISPESQESLSYATGLAPVLARCRTPDKQADDARYWIAATNEPLPGLSRETTLSDEQLQSLGIALSALIRR